MRDRKTRLTAMVRLISVMGLVISTLGLETEPAVAVEPQEWTILGTQGADVLKGTNVRRVHLGSY